RTDRKRCRITGWGRYDHPVTFRRGQPSLIPRQAVAKSSRRAAGQAVWRGAVFSGRHVQGRARRQAADARVLLQYLHDQRSVPTGLPVLPGADGAADEAGAVVNSGQWSVASEEQEVARGETSDVLTDH